MKTALFRGHFDTPSGFVLHYIRKLQIQILVQSADTCTYQGNRSLALEKSLLEKPDQWNRCLAESN